MTTRSIKFKETADVQPCPKCGNKTEFTIRSGYCAEDCCEVWAECKCGFEHGSEDRFEDVWGGCNNANVMAAISCWNDAVLAAEARAMAAADMTTYTLTITEQQARTISTACELMARLGMGQWPEALSHLPMQDSKRGGDHISALLPYMAGLLVDGIDGWGSHLGIRGARTPETARTAWDLYAVIRHRLAWDAAVERGLTAGEFRNWRTMGGVHYDDPEHIGKEPLATIERAPTT